MALHSEQASWFAGTFDQLVANLDIAIKGKEDTIRLALTCMLSRGHLLLEDNPGTGKTVLAKSIARTVQGKHSRIQFTPDLLPSDVTGSTIYNQQSKSFEFRPGPIFANIVLADEINRASPKTQSALLEVMEEGRVTVDGTSHVSGDPFMVIATMNPIEQEGTYQLPEAQLDRFLMKTSLGYPDRQVTVELLADAENRERFTGVTEMITSEAVTQMQDLVGEVHADTAVLDYIARIAEATRRSSDTTLGASIRGCLAFVRAAKTWAASQGRSFVTPDDVKTLCQPVFGHRVLITPDAQFKGVTSEQIVAEILDELPPPANRGSAPS